MENEKNLTNETDPIKKLACMNIPEAERENNREYMNAYYDALKEVTLKSPDITPNEREILVFLLGYEDDVIRDPEEAAEKFGITLEHLALISKKAQMILHSRVTQAKRKKFILDYL